MAVDFRADIRVAEVGAEHDVVGADAALQVIQVFVFHAGDVDVLLLEYVVVDPLRGDAVQLHARHRPRRARRSADHGGQPAGATFEYAEAELGKSRVDVTRDQLETRGLQRRGDV